MRISSFPAIAAFVAPTHHSSYSSSFRAGSTRLHWIPPTVILADDEMQLMETPTQPELVLIAPSPPSTAELAAPSNSEGKSRKVPLLGEFVREWVKKEAPVATKQIKATLTDLESKLQEEMKEIDTELLRRSGELRDKVLAETPELSRRLQSNLDSMSSKLEKEIKDIDWVGISASVKNSISSVEARLAEIQEQVAHDEKVQSASKELEKKLLTGWKNDWRKLALEVPSSTPASSPEEAAEKVSGIKKAMEDLRGSSARSLEQYQVQAAKDLEDMVTMERSRLQALYTEELEDLRMQLDAAKKDIATLAEEHAKEIASFEKSSREAISEQEKVIFALKAVGESRLETIKQMQQEFLTMTSDYNNQVEGLQRKHRAEIEMLQRQLEESLKSFETKYKAEKEQLLEDLASKISEIDTLRAAAERENYDFQRELSQTHMENQQNLKELATINAELQQALEENSKLASAIAAAEQQQADLQELLEEANLENNKLKEDSARASDELEMARKDRSDAVSAMVEIERENAGLQKQLEEVKMKNDRESDELKKISDELNRVREEQSNLIEVAGEKARQEVIQRAKEAFARARIQYDALGQDYETAKLRIAELEMQLEAGARVDTPQTPKESQASLKETGLTIPPTDIVTDEALEKKLKTESLQNLETGKNEKNIRNSESKPADSSGEAGKEEVINDSKERMVSSRGDNTDKEQVAADEIASQEVKE